MNGLRFATAEEAMSVADTAGLEPGCSVMAMDTQHGTILGVARLVPELDPVFYPDGIQDRKKLEFIRAMEAFMLGRGYNFYYFNVHAESEQDQKWITCCEEYGAQRTSMCREFRYKRVI